MSLFKRFFKFPLRFFAKKPEKEELMKRLTREQFYVTQQCGTEPPFRNEYWQHKEKGSYSCVVCDEELFSSEHKYDSGTGWPSFYDVVNKDEIEVKVDSSHGMIREEVTCKCGAHLGHKFLDGPRDKTGTRYCINSASLLFKNKL